MEVKDMEAKELARAISNAVNSYSFKHTEFNEQMMKEHRTIQQSFMRLIRNYCIYVAEQPDYMFDDRNLASREFAKQVAELNIGLPML